jgi:tRNA threonylcarbamoyl adenosine modification protein (Sua5/YciO/YrdC/YwlC family)
MTVRFDCTDDAERARGITAAVAAIKRGELVVLPTESVYAVATDGFSARGARSVREAKGQSAVTPLPIMIPSVTTIPGIAFNPSVAAMDLMHGFWPGALTVLVTPQPSLAWDHPSGAPLAVRIPLHPLTLEILRLTGPLIVTGANRVGNAVPTTADHALESLGESATICLDAGALGSDPTLSLPSTVVDATGEIPLLLREGALTFEQLRAVVPTLTTPQ